MGVITYIRGEATGSRPEGARGCIDMRLRRVGATPQPARGRPLPVSHGERKPAGAAHTSTGVESQAARNP
jgi:hypothetical protein